VLAHQVDGVSASSPEISIPVVTQSSPEAIHEHILSPILETASIGKSKPPGRRRTRSTAHAVS